MNEHSTTPRVQTGLDLLPEHNLARVIKGKKVAVLCHHASVNSRLEHIVPIVRDRMGADVIRLFGPEHGVWSTHQDMEAVPDNLDPVFQIPTFSLYGSDVHSLAPAPSSLDSVEAVVADLSDIGTRFYTYAATVVAMARACAEQKIPLVVLDRPNPIDGIHREGGPIAPGFDSFVGAINVPIRHGLTLGELVRAGVEAQSIDVELYILSCRGWDRSMMFPETGLPWVPPSPNMPTFETAVVYPGMCLIEATTISEGRGTTTPFLVFGAPGIDPLRLVSLLDERALPGIAFRPHVFRPMFQKHAMTTCFGAQIVVTAPKKVHGLELGIHILDVLINHFPDSFGWRPEPYEFVIDRPAIDLLTGDPQFRQLVEGGQNLDALLERWDQQAQKFNPTRGFMP